MPEKILTVEDLEIKFELRGKTLHAIRGISMELHRGEILAIVGESGSGKSVFTKSFMGLLDQNGHVTAGKVTYYGADNREPVELTSLKKEKEWLKIRGREIAMIMQDPMTSLSPLKTIGVQIMEAVLLHQNVNRAEAKARTLQYLADVGISEPEKRFGQYPHEFSGGMRQRVVIAIAIACNPQILICDEPTTALDVTIQAQILDLIKELRHKYHLSVILITHDLGVVADICSRIDVMYAGLVMEEGKTDDVFFNPAHPYTMGLLRSIPNVATGARHRLIPIPGTPPDLLNPPQGCPFSPRCSFTMNICTRHCPGYYQVGEGHKAACWLLDEHAPRCGRYDAMKGGISSIER